MKIASVICEYNPFHNGHKYQLDKIKEEYDAVICVMSGAFVQRGEPAIFDKWSRAHSALINGADLVVELPVCFALNSAERFAYGGVELIEKMRVVDAICFGSESGDIYELIKASELITNETDDISAVIKSYLDKGYSFPKARALAYKNEITSAILSEPNNILAIEYIKAIKLLNSNIKPMTIKRYKSQYNEIVPKSKITSATAIRNLINNKKSIKKYTPKNLYKLYKTLSPADINELTNILLYILRTKPIDELSLINDVTEGLENRIKDFSFENVSIEQLADLIDTKRYTKAKINRILMSIILNLTKDIVFNENEYLRVLGMNQTGIKILSEIKEKSSLQIITKAADFKNFNKSFNLDIFSGDIYSLCNKDSSRNFRDYYNSPIIIK